MLWVVRCCGGSFRIGAAEASGDTICHRKGSQMTFDLIVSPAQWVRQVSRVENWPTTLVKRLKSANQDLIMHQMPTHGVGRSRAAGSGCTVRVWPIEVRAAAKPSALAAALLLYCPVCSPRRSPINFFIFFFFYAAVALLGRFAPRKPTRTFCQSKNVTRNFKRNRTVGRNADHGPFIGNQVTFFLGGGHWEPCKGRPLDEPFNQNH